MKKNTNYFPHDHNARGDEKILQLRVKHGWKGYGLYWAIAEKLYEAGGALKKDYNLLAYDLKDNPDLIKSVIEDFELFIVNEHKFTAARVVAHIEFISQFSKHGKEGADKRWSKLGLMSKPRKKTEWDKMLDFFGTCVKCEGKSGDYGIDKDHIVLTSKGGEDHPSNWQPLCAKCNSSKGLDMTDYRIPYCKKHHLNIPPLWLPHNPPNANKEINKQINKHTEQAEAVLKKVFSKGLNIYSLINKLKKQLGWPREKQFPAEVIIAVCEQYLNTKGTIKNEWAWFTRVIQAKSEDWHAAQNIEEHKKLKDQGSTISLKQILEGAKE